MRTENGGITTKKANGGKQKSKGNPLLFSTLRIRFSLTAISVRLYHILRGRISAQLRSAVLKQRIQRLSGGVNIFLTVEVSVPGRESKGWSFDHFLSCSHYDQLRRTHGCMIKSKPLTISALHYQGTQEENEPLSLITSILPYLPSVFLQELFKG